IVTRLCTHITELETSMVLTSLWLTTEPTWKFDTENYPTNSTIQEIRIEQSVIHPMRWKHAAQRARTCGCSSDTVGPSFAPETILTENRSGSTTVSLQSLLSLL